MVLEGILNIASRGMQVQSRGFANAASVIANPATNGDADITGALLDTQMASQAFKANAIAYETGVEFWDMLLMIKRDDD